MESVAQETSETKSVRVSRVVDRPLTQVWETLIGPPGASALLGAGGSFGNKAEDWRADDGSHGVVRSLHPNQQVRFSLHTDEGAPGSLVDVQLHADGDARTTVSLSHEHLPAGTDEQDLTARWTSALESIAGSPT